MMEALQRAHELAQAFPHASLVAACAVTLVIGYIVQVFDIAKL